MAKKKRKHFIKINNRVRSLFGSLPFDEGITKIDDENLLGLLMSLEIPSDSLEREDIIRLLRRLWSEGDYSIRKKIVDYLEESIKKSRELTHNSKIETIMDFLKPLNPSKDEEEIILESFLDSKISKITEKKVSNRLYF